MMYAKHVCALLMLLIPITAAAVDRVHIVIRAFIPDSRDSNPGYIKRLTDGTTVIPAPPISLVTPAMRAVTPRAVEAWAKKNVGNWKGALLSGALAKHCFKTDGRTFTSSTVASARLHFEATLVIDGSSVRVENPVRRSRPFWSDATHLVDCQTGRNLVPPLTGDPYFVDAPFRPGSSIGQPRVEGNEVRLFIRGSGGNPLAPLLESITPAVDFSGLITFDRQTKKLHFRGLAGVFPAIEGYASLNGDAPRTIFQLSPKDGTTVWDLADLDTGVNSRGIDRTVDLAGDVVVAETEARPLVPWKLVQRSQFIATVLSMPGGLSVDTALLGAIASHGADAGMTGPALDKLIASAAGVLRKQEHELERTGYGAALDRVTLVRRKVERLRSTKEFASIPVVQALSHEVRSIGVVPRSPGREPGYLMETLLRALIEQVALRSQEATSNSTLLPVLQKRVFSEIGISPLDRPENLASALTTAVSDPAVTALSTAIVEQRLDPIGVILGGAVLQSIPGSVVAHGARLKDTVSHAVQVLEGDGKLPPKIEDFVLSEITQRTGIDALRVRESVRTLEADGLSIANAEAGLYLASTLGGLVDPKLGRDIERFGSAAIGVYRAVNAFSSSASMANSIFALGASGATGNFLGAAMTMSSILGGGGLPGMGGDQTPALRMEIAGLRKQIEELAKHMDERFDRVDRSLDRIYVDMNAGFERIERRLAGLEGDARHIQLYLSSLSGRLDAFEALVRRGQRELLEEMKAIEVEGCLRWRSEIGKDKPLAEDKFYWCAIELAGFAVRQAALEAHTGGSSWDLSEAGLPARLLDPFNNVKLLFAAAQYQGVNLVTPGELDQLVSPRNWGVAVEDYMKLLTDWPQYAVNIKPAQIERVRAAGEDIHRGIAAISDPKTGRDLFVSLLRSYLNSALDLQVELERRRNFLIGGKVEPLLRWPMSRDTKQFEQESLLARARGVLGQDLGNNALALAKALGSAEPAYSSKSPRETEMERGAARNIYEDLAASRLAPTAVRNLDVYARLIAGFVEVGFADDLRRNDILSAFVRGNNQLPDSRWLFASQQLLLPIDELAKTALTRALALWTMLDKVMSEPRAPSERGDPTIDSLLAQLSILSQQRHEHCKLLPASANCVLE